MIEGFGGEVILPLAPFALQRPLSDQPAFTRCDDVPVGVTVVARGADAVSPNGDHSDERLGTTRGIQLSLMLWRWCAGSCGRGRRLFAGCLERLTRQKCCGNSRNV